MDEEIRRLQEKIAYLERHVTGQDRAMLELAEDLARLRREIAALRGLVARGSAASEANPEPDERPPHY